jgi:flagellar motor component MotA
VRRFLIQTLLPFLFCLVPLLAAVVIGASLPTVARQFYLGHLANIDFLILTLGGSLFAVQMLLTFRALRWRGTKFDDGPDPWLSHLAQASEWFPLLGLIGTVAGILQTFSRVTSTTPPEVIIQSYAPAITATGSGLFMALVNILPAWVVLMGRGLIVALGGQSPPDDTPTPSGTVVASRSDGVKRTV